MDPKRTAPRSGGRGGRGVGAVNDNWRRPSLRLAEWTLDAGAAVVSWPRTRCVSGMVSIGAVLMLLMQSSLASDGKTDAAAPANLYESVFTVSGAHCSVRSGFIIHTKPHESSHLLTLLGVFACVRAGAHGEHNTRMLSRCDGKEKQQLGCVRRVF